MRPLAFPVPTRTWSKDSEEIYSEKDGVTPMFNMTFLMNNPVFMPGAVFPAPLGVGFTTGNLRIDTTAENLTMPLLVDGVSDENVKDTVFENLLGTYTCNVENEYGFDQATSVISDCDGKHLLYSITLVRP